MKNESSLFVGTIPEAYDAGLGPVLFEDFAADFVRRVGAPEAVLEIAAGTGILSRKLRDALPRASRLVVTDLNPPMLEVARRKFAADEKVEFGEADAMALPFDDASFDLVACQFGVMFFPDKIAAFREAARVLRPGGRYIFSSWGSHGENAFARIVHATLESFFPADPPPFYRVPFSYGDPGLATRDMRAAGWTAIDHAVLSEDRAIADFGGFTRSLIYGNPVLDQIRQRGGVGPDEIVSALRERFLDAFGPQPVTLRLQTHVFVGALDVVS